MNRVTIARALASPLLRGLGATWRYLEVAADGTERAARRDLEPAVFALWHGELLALTLRYMPNGVGVMISHHRDGDIATGIVEALGGRVVRGSSSAGGATALQRLARLGAEGRPLALTTDGPRGPARRSKPGIIRVAALSGLPIVPVSAVPARAWRAKSWDEFLVPRPFARIFVGFGEPISVPRDVPREELGRWTARLDTAIDEMSAGCRARAEAEV